MRHLSERRPQARIEGIFGEPVGADLVLYDEHNLAAHALTRSATSVWELCDGRHTLEQMARELGLELTIVERSIAEFDERALLVEHAADQLSRRTALRRLAGLGGTAVTAASLISTVVMPPASAAASTCSAPGQGCAAFWTNADCTGTKTMDTCPSGCACQAGSCVDDGIYNGSCG